MKEKLVVIAFFDILGTSKKLESNEMLKVYDYYKYMIKLCSDETVPIIIKNILYGKNLKILGKQKPYVLLCKELKHAFFSDTFIIWVEIDDFFIESLEGFFEKCSVIFCEALKRNIPLRGTISIGKAIMDEKEKIFLGYPLAEAAKGETCQNWLGIGLGKSFKSIHTFDTRYILPYSEHIKSNENNYSSLLNSFALDWPRWWRECEKINEYGDINTVISRMNTDLKFRSYYENCLRFYEYSKDGDNIWENKTAIPGITKQAISPDLIQHFIVLRK